MQIFDYILIGQGISGSVLGYKLRKAGYKVVQLDTINTNSPSRVAAGIWHPMVFKRLGKTWNAHAFLPEVFNTYKAMELDMKASFFHPTEYLRLLNGTEQENDWDVKSENPALQELMGMSLANKYPMEVQASGFGQVKQAGFLDTDAFLEATRGYFGNSLLNERFIESRLSLVEDRVTYDSKHLGRVKANKLIFANGLGVGETELFDWLPFQPVKGEVITIQSEGLSVKEIISKGVFVCPVGDGLFNIGATYNWRELNDTPTEKGQEELVDKLKAIIKTPFKIVSHKAGVRPAVKGRRPLIGTHPEHKNVYVFSGMGSKAVLMVPHLANHLLNHLESGTPLMDEVNLSRFYSLYSPIDNEQD